MAWFKVDDTFAFHPKVGQAGNAAIGLWIRAGAWSSAHLTDGHIPREMLPAFAGTAALAKALVKAGLWTETDSGYAFHDWDQYQPSGAETEARKTNRSAAAALGNHLRWHKKRGVTDLNCVHCKPSQSRSEPDRNTDRSSDR